MSVKILVGDCRDVLRELPDESVQCVVTSPPYYGLRDYGEDEQIGLEPTPNEYVSQMVEVFREVRRVLSHDGVVWLNLGDSYATSGIKQTGRNDEGPADLQRRFEIYGTGRPKAETGLNERTKAGGTPGLKPKDLIGIPWRVAFALQADGWWLRSDVIWHKTNPMPESVTDRPTRAHEYVFLLSKSARYFYDAEAVKEDGSGRIPGNVTPQKMDRSRNDGGLSGIFKAQQKPQNHRNRRSVWTISTKPYSGAHFAVMPPDLAEVCIKAGTSERGACPECGAPWERITERTPMEGWRPTCECKRGDGWYWCEDCQLTKHIDDLKSGCPSCGETMTPAPHEPIPCTVLDPFGGAGTTALVADRLGRDAIIVELNSDYVEMARQRIVGEIPMFADVELVA